MNTIKKASALGAVLLAATLTVGIAAPAYADDDPVIADGDWEGSWGDGSWYSTVYTPGTAVGQTGAWTVTEGLAQLGAGGGIGKAIRLLNFDPSEGLDGPRITSAVSQTFVTTPGATYHVGFLQFNNGTTNVLINGVVIYSPAPGIGVVGEDFVADSETTTITFQYTSDVIAEPGIVDSTGGFDNIGVIQIECGDPNDGSSIPNCLPTPMIDIVIGAGAAVVAAGMGTVFYIRRRKQAAASELGAA